MKQGKIEKTLPSGEVEITYVDLTPKKTRKRTSTKKEDQE